MTEPAQTEQAGPGHEGPPGIALDDEPLGSGGFGTVWRGEDLVLRRTVAVKVFPAAATVALEDFWREARIATLEHPNIVTVYRSATMPDGAPCLVMAYMPFGSLVDRAGGRPLLAAKVALIGSGIADALATAHSRSIVHGDLTPGNVLFDEYDTARLADFGSARVISTSTPAGSTPFTRAFAAPEVVIGGPTSPLTDVWGLAATLCAALTGSAPFGNDDGRVSERIRNDPPPALDGQPALLRNLLHEALSKAPEDRPTAAEFRDRLRPLIVDAPPDPASASEMADDWLRSVMTVRMPKGQGSGVAVTLDGIVATNAHVVVGTDDGRAVLLRSDGTEVGAQVLKWVGPDPQLKDVDIAFLQIDDEVSDLPPVLPNARTRDIRKGMAVFALGAPRGFDHSLIDGTVSALRPKSHEGSVQLPADGGDFGELIWIQHTADIAPGNSGGPLVDASGRLLGVNTWGRLDSGALKFALDVDTVVRELRILQREQAERPTARCCLACGAFARTSSGCSECHAPEHARATMPGADAAQPDRAGEPRFAPVPMPDRTITRTRAGLGPAELLEFMAYPEGTTASIALARPDPSGQAGIQVSEGSAAAFGLQSAEVDFAATKAALELGHARSGSADPLLHPALSIAAHAVGASVLLLRTTRLASQHQTRISPADLPRAAWQAALAGARAYLVWAVCAPDGASGPGEFEAWWKLLDREFGRLQLDRRIGQELVDPVRHSLLEINLSRQTFDQARSPSARKREAMITGYLALDGFVDQMSKVLVAISIKRSGRQALAAGQSELNDRRARIAEARTAVGHELGLDT